MFAVIKTGGRQFIVKKGDVLEINKIPQQKGERVEFKDVLGIFGDKFLLGQPILDNVVVQGEVLSQEKGEKVTIIKYKPKTRYRKKMGFRPLITKVKIKEIKIKS
ncbi:50S ribosomal protein L21 [bacterium]|nr:50S ribosomal protein L21 [bacterium]